MRLSVAVPVLWALWALLRFWVRERWLPPMTVPFRRVALRVVVDQVITVAGVAAVTLTALWTGITLANLLGAADVQSTRWLLGRIASASDAARDLSETLGIGLMLLFTLASVIVWHLSARAAARRRWHAAAEAEIERLLKEREADPAAWNATPPNDLMAKVDEHLSILHEHWQAVHRDAKLSEEERGAEVERIQAQAQEWLDLRTRIDISRRVHLRDTPSTEAEGWRERVMIALASRGLIADAKSAATYVGLAAIALSLATMVGFAGSNVTSGLTRAVNVLEIKATRAAAEASLTNAEAAAPADAPVESAWTPSDEAALDQIARAIVDTALRSNSVPLPPPGGAAAGAAGSGSASASAAAEDWVEPADVWEQDRRDSVRRAILEEPGGKPGAVQTEPSAPRGPPVVERAANARSQEAAVSALVDESKARLRQDLQRPSVLRAFRQHAAGYRHVATPATIRSGLVSSIFAQALGAAPLPVELRGVAGNLAEELSASAVRDFMRAREVAALESLVRGQSFADALVAVDASPAPLRHTRGASRAFSGGLDAAGVRDWLDTHAPEARTVSGAPTDEAISVGRRILASAEGAPRDVLEAFAAYDDYFPARLEGERSTALGALTREAEAAAGNIASAAPTIEPPFGGSGASLGGGGGGGSGGGGSRSARSSNSRVSYARARSFRMARGFARVGGVLIGRPPDRSRGPKPQTTGITWGLDADKVSLQLGTTRVGTYRGAILDAALRYAADGRITTVTMTSAAPLLELKILLHPVLEDTPTGADAIELDRFVDTYARSVPSVRREEARIMGQYALYRAAWALRQLAFLELADRTETQAGIQRIRAELASLAPQLTAALNEPRAELLDPRRSILASKPAWFDSGLVRRIHDAASSGSVAGWQAQLAVTFASDVKALDSEDKAKQLIATWFDQPAEFQLWSGVREQTWSADASFAFARAPDGDELWPFQFMLQAAFTTPPKFGGSDVDESPFEFDNVASDIQRAVALGIHSPQGEAAGHPVVVAHMREFVVLQRIFRLAFAGQLGSRFPLERLAALAADVRPLRARLATPRWNPRPGALERVFLGALDAATIAASLDPDHAGLAAGLNRCRGVVSIATPFEAWESSCDFKDAERTLRRACEADRARCRLAEIVGALNTLTQARRLRHELKVDESVRRVVAPAESRQ
jgi:hypothetical protein